MAKTCWHCGCAWEEKRSPTFGEDCLDCREPLHCCRNCRFYDERMSMWCREPQARDERPRDAEQANRCSYFVFVDRPEGAGRQRSPKAGAKGGDSPGEGGNASSALDDIFKSDAGGVG